MRVLTRGMGSKEPAYPSQEPDSSGIIPGRPPDALSSSSRELPGCEDFPNRRVRLLPSIAAFCLNSANRHNGGPLNMPYRLYLLLREMEIQGRGQINLSEVEATLTRRGTPSYIYGKRQLKNVLALGEGLFWNRVKVRGRIVIRMVSHEKLAAALGLEVLRGHEVEMPVQKLLGSGPKRQTGVDAELYAAWHAGRKAAEKPINRNAISKATGVPKIRQRRLEARSGISVSRNFYILSRYSDYKLQRARLHHNLPAFKLTDYHGRVDQHKRGKAYVAVRLPNTYQTPEQFRALKSRRQRTINRNLSAGLRNHGHAGIGQDQIVKVFHDNVRSASDAFERDQEVPAYRKIREVGTKTGIWRSLHEEH